MLKPVALATNSELERETETDMAPIPASVMEHAELIDLLVRVSEFLDTYNRAVSLKTDVDQMLETLERT